MISPKKNLAPIIARILSLGGREDLLMPNCSNCSEGLLTPYCSNCSDLLLTPTESDCSNSLGFFEFFIF